jgi:hypothetical protein
VTAECSKLCHLKAKDVHLFHCLTKEGRGKDKGVNGLKETKKEGEGCRHKSNYFPLDFNRLFH